jgi:uncharacterized protein (UPF0332 family)
MVTRLTNSTLLNISRFDAGTLNHIGFGIHLSSSVGLTFEELIQNATRDRMRLAGQMLKSAQVALGSKPLYRTCVGRAYYSMYHAARSVIFYVAKGDDHQDHSVLPKHFPKDFPDLIRWENDLKFARLERNRADYDPYPKADNAYAKSARLVLKNTEEFVPTAKRYLRRKGCKI